MASHSYDKVPKSISIVFLTIAIALVCSCASAATITVCSSGCNYTRIQDAINYASDGDTIRVMSGSYSEVIVVNKSVILMGINSTGKFPDIGKYTMPVAVTIAAPNVTFDGFMIHGAGEHALVIEADRTKVRNILFSIHRPGDPLDAIITGSGLSEIEISNCAMSSSGVLGIFLQDSSNLTIKDNYVSVNSFEGGTATGIYGYYTTDTGTYTDINIEGNEVYGGPIDVSVMYRFENPPQPELHNIRIFNNRVRESKTFGIYIGGNIDVNNNEYHYHRHNVTVERNTITDYTTRQGIEVAWAQSGSILHNVVNNGLGGFAGLRLAYATGFSFINNTVTNVTGGSQVVGIDLSEVKETVVSQNTMTGNQMNFAYTPGGELTPHMTIDTTNIADGRSIYYYEGRENFEVNQAQDPASLILVDCEKVLVRDIAPSKNDAGIVAYNSRDVTIRDCDIKDCYNGVLLSMVERLNFFDNTIDECRSAVVLYDLKESSIRNNTITGCGGAINHYITSSGTSINDNTFSDCQYGIWTYFIQDGSGITYQKNTLTRVDLAITVIASDYLTFTENIIRNCSQVGIFAKTSQSNTFARNIVECPGIEEGTNTCVGLINVDTIDNKTIYRGGNHTFFDNYFNGERHVVIENELPSLPDEIVWPRWLQYSSSGMTQPGDEDILPDIWNITKTAGTNIVGGPYLGGNYWAYPNGTGWSQTHPDRGDGFCNAPYIFDSYNTDYLPLHLQGGEIPITAPAVIDKPGRYRLTNDLFNSSVETAIWIKASDVYLNGGGHTLQGVSEWNTTGVLAGKEAMGLSNITINNIFTTGWMIGLSVEGVAGSTISECTSKGNMEGVAIADSSDLTIKMSNISENIPWNYEKMSLGGSGIMISSSPQTRIFDTKISNNGWGDYSPLVGGYGVNLLASEGSYISGCTIWKNLNTGIWSENSKDVVFIGNDIRDNEGNGGIFIVAPVSDPNMNCIIKDNTISGSAWGIWLYRNDYQVINNTVTECENGILLTSCQNATLKQNTMAENSLNFGVLGEEDEQYLHQIDTSNTVNGRPIYYLVGQSGAVIDAATDAGVVYAISCPDITIRDISTNQNQHGVFLLNSDRAVITNVTTKENTVGFTIQDSPLTHLDRCTAQANIFKGFWVLDSEGVHLTNSDAIKTVDPNPLGEPTGITVKDSPSSHIENVNASQNNWFGIELDNADQANLVGVNVDTNVAAGLVLSGDSIRVTGSYIRDNEGPGIGMLDSSNLTFWNNYLSNNENFDLSQGVITGSSWNIEKTTGINIVKGPYLGGNYWANPEGTGWSQVTPDRGDGFCNAPFQLDANNIDSLPLHIYEGEIPITAPAVIDKPGRYKLMNNLSNSSVEKAIWIKASDVVLNGDGHSLGGTVDAENPLLGVYGVFVGSEEGILRNITIRNISTNQWEQGIRIQNSTNLDVSNCTSTKNYVGLSIEDVQDAFIYQCTLSENILDQMGYRAWGLSIINSDGVIVRENDIHSNKQFEAPLSSSGIICTDSKVLISGNHIWDHDGAGILSAPSTRGEVIVLDNLIDNFGGKGIEVYQNGAEELVLIDNNIINGPEGIIGILTNFAQSVNITNNTITCGERGIAIVESKNNVLSHNTIQGAKTAFGIISGQGETPYYYHTIDDTNTVDGKPIRYYKDTDGLLVDSSVDAATVIAVNCRDGVIRDKILSKNHNGVLLVACQNMTVINSVLNANFNGIETYSTERCVIDNIVTSDSTFIGQNLNNDTTIRVTDCISENNVGFGFVLNYDEGFVLHNCIVNSNGFDIPAGAGISASHSSGTITNLSASLNTRWGILMMSNSVLSIDDSHISDTHGNGVQSENSEFSIHNSEITQSENTGVTVYNNGASIQMQGCSIKDSNYAGIWFSNVVEGTPSVISNNFFNNTQNALIEGVNSPITWNTTKTAGKNIVNGPYLGGNYWADPNGNGWSQVTPDRGDGFCNAPFVIDEENSDSLPLHLYNPSLKADFSATPLKGPLPLKVTFTDTSVGNPTEWIWDFGDKKKSDQQYPIHTYSVQGTYSVKLTVKKNNEDGTVQSNTTIKKNLITVYKSPGPIVLASFTAAPLTGKAPLQVQFTDTSTGSPNYRTWDFGDFGFSFKKSLTHTYIRPGTYSVKLTTWKTGVGFKPAANATLKKGLIVVT
jgi:parallel beta-helix repeat protein